MQTWEEAQKWELDWHLRQQFNTFNEEKKQYYYASLMGLDQYATNYYGIRGWNFGNKSVIDIGGGEVSILLKSDGKNKTVIDPLPYPAWVKVRYREAGVNFINEKAEIKQQFEKPFDIALMYNCLQHTEDPQKIVKNMRSYARVCYVFEWINEPISDGHLQDLTEDKLNAWFGGFGRVARISEGPMQGEFYTGLFKGDHYGI